MTTSNELFHYGVKGMRWGIRKDKYKRMGVKERFQHLRAYNTGRRIVKRSKTPEGAFLRRLDLANRAAFYFGGAIGYGAVDHFISSRSGIDLKKLDQKILQTGKNYINSRSSRKKRR